MIILNRSYLLKDIINLFRLGFRIDIILMLACTNDAHLVPLFDIFIKAHQSNEDDELLTLIKNATRSCPICEYQLEIVRER